MSTWQSVAQKHAELSVREKALILISALVIIVFLLGTFVIEPQFNALTSAQSQQDKIQSNIDETRTQRMDIDDKIASDPRGKLEDQLEGLMKKHQQLVAQLAKRELSLVSSDEMVNQVEALVAESRGLTLEKLDSIAPLPILFEQQSDPQAKRVPLLYRHGIKVQVKGNYFSVVKFLQRIEQQNEFLLWQDIDYMVEEHPDALVTFSVFTLSTDKEFIGVK